MMILKAKQHTLTTIGIIVVRVSITQAVCIIVN